MARIEIAVEMKGIYSYEAVPYSGYGCETHYIYNMTDENGKVYVWKTTTFLYVPCNDGTGKINKGDKLVITATVKGESEYKGQPQTILQRVKLVKRTFKAKTWEEIQEERRLAKEEEAKKQIESIKDGDMLWVMPYKQYKEHYADCETVKNSFTRRNGVAEITVIIREGRLKASGVRGEHYSGYRLVNELGEHVTYRAVKEENAIKRAIKDFPDHVWTCDEIFNYDNYHRIW